MKVTGIECELCGVFFTLNSNLLNGDVCKMCDSKYSHEDIVCEPVDNKNASLRHIKSERSENIIHH